MFCREQRMPGQPAPRREVSRRAGIERDEPEHRARVQRLHAKAKLHDEISAAEVAGIPAGIDRAELAHEALGIGVARA